jgi:hypothetical protein
MSLSEICRTTPNRVRRALIELERNTRPAKPMTPTRPLSEEGWLGLMILLGLLLAFVAAEFYSH